MRREGAQACLGLQGGFPGGVTGTDLRREGAARSTSARLAEEGGLGMILSLLKQWAKYIRSTFYPLVSHHYAHFEEGENEERFQHCPWIACGVGVEGGQCWDSEAGPYQPWGHPIRG